MVFYRKTPIILKFEVNTVAAAANTSDSTLVKAEPEPVKTVEWAIFRHPAVKSLMVFQWCADNCEFTLRSLGPTFFMESFQVCFCVFILK